MTGFAILLLFNLLGLVARHALGVPLPANVLGMVFLAVALFSGVVKLRWVEPAANVLLRHMLMLFLPFVIGALALLPLLKQSAAGITAGVILSTLAAMAVTGWVAEWRIPPGEGDGDGAEKGPVGRVPPDGGCAGETLYGPGGPDGGAA